MAKTKSTNCLGLDGGSVINISSVASTTAPPNKLTGERIAASGGFR